MVALSVSGRTKLHLMPHIPSFHRHAVLQVTLLSLLLALAWSIYSPGLRGSFLFDDFANLPTLGAQGPIDNWPAFWRYITSGHADPTGRPLAMLSFLVDAHNWPADPLPFKRTNLILHLGNGVLLAWLLLRLGREIYKPASKSGFELQRTDLAAIVGTAFWLLHPLWISTTLYIVQREAILPTTFTLLGLLLWLHGRNSLSKGRTFAGVLQVAGGLGVCTLLATLCKANGILLPALALVIEYILLPATAKNSNIAYRRALCLFAWLPAGTVALYLAWQGLHGCLFGISSLRPWTLGQRLLTEPRVLVNYLGLLWMPRPFTAGLFNDQILVSTSLWSPRTTAPSILAIAFLIFGGWMLRKRSPPIAAAILFYFVGQSLESSTIPLELYFEHRNYLPALLMFWPLALWLCDVPLLANLASIRPPPAREASPKAAHIAKLLLALLMALGLSSMTYAGAQLWGNTKEQALVWAKLNPDSPRAQVSAADVEMSEGHPALAVMRLQPLLTRYPDQVQIALNLFGAECSLGNVKPDTLNAARISLSTARDPGVLLTSWFSRVIDQTVNPPCPELTGPVVSSLLDAALHNNYLKDIPGRLQDIYYLKGLLALKQQRPDLALSNFNHALDLQVRAELALEQAAMLGASGHPQLGLAHLEHYQSQQPHEAAPLFGMPRVHGWVLSKQHYWQNELVRLRATLQQDSATRTQRQP
jgi:tetratricopeptide (TPR) repeat protein